jgi:hypothetical protein
MTDDRLRGRNTYPMPCRGDQVDRWLQAKLDAWTGGTDAIWHLLDDLLKDYRLHADTGTSLDAEVGPLVTKAGKVLADADIEALADEAERGYDV